MKKNIFYSVGICLIAAGLFAALRFSMAAGNVPWFSGRLEIDGSSYINGMLSIAQSKDFLNLQDIYHSPGYQIYLGLLYRLDPAPQRIFLTVKVVAWVLYVLSVVIVYLLGARFLGWRAGLMAAGVLALSNKFHIYANLIQYETLLGFLILCHLFLLAVWRAEKPWKGSLVPVLAGLLAAAIVLVQVRYLLLVPAGCLCFYLRARASQEFSLRKALAPVGAYLLPFLIIVGFWSVHHSLREGQVILVSKGSSFRFQAGNNPNAKGYSWPYPVIVEPSGFSFILRRPAQFLNLVAQRLMYFMDIKKDGGSMPLPFSEFAAGSRAPLIEKVFYLMSLFALLGGIIVKGGSGAEGPSAAAPLCLLLTFAAGVAAPLLIFSSSRFSVPLLPVIFLLQARFFDSLAGRFKTSRSD